MTDRLRRPARQVFVMVDPVIPRVTRWALALAAVALGLIGWQLHGLFPPEVWRHAAQVLLSEGLPQRQGWALASGLLPLLLAGVVIALDRLQRRRARLILDEGGLRFESGLPVLQRWLDWQLPLEALRQGRPRWRLTTVPAGSNPLALTRLGWGLAGLRGVRPARWHLSGAPDPAIPPLHPPHRPLGFVNWRHPANAAWLQQRFESLPLVQALRERGVALPPWQTLQSAAEGPDLMAHPRLRVVLLLLAGLVLSGGVLLHLSRHQHYMAPWSNSAWLAVAAVVANLTLAWHLTLAPPMPADRSSRWALRFAQAFTTVLMVVLVGWNLYHLPLAWGRAFGSAQTVDHVLDLEAGRLRPVGPAASTPAIVINPNARRWREQPDGAHHPVLLRQGPGGWWTQFDSEDTGHHPAEATPDPAR